MPFKDLRGWLQDVNRMGELNTIEGADWDLEMGFLSFLNARKKDPPVLLFDKIKGYPSGYRVITCSISNAKTLGLTFGLPVDYSDLQLCQAFREKFLEWGARLEEFPPEVIQDGPILENVHSGQDVDLLEFPAPKWHELDEGRYIGTGDAVITRDPDTGDVNLGTYRIQVHDKKNGG